MADCRFLSQERARDGILAGTLFTDTACVPEAGYFPEGANATSDNDAQVAFAEGESAFRVSGNWSAAELSEEMGDDVGFFLAPGVEEGEAPVASGVGSPSPSPRRVSTPTWLRLSSTTCARPRRLRRS